MNLKTLVWLKAMSAKPAPAGFSFAHKIGYYCGPLGSDDAKRAALETGNNEYCACTGTVETEIPLGKTSRVEGTYYPIMLNGATKLHFDVPDGVKATVFFSDSTNKASGYNAVAWVSGDASPYDSNVQNGARDVTVPDGADCFSFSLYYRQTEITDEIVNTVKVTAI